MNAVRHFALLARRPWRPISHFAFRCQRSFSITPRVHARIKWPSEPGSSLGSFEEVANLPAIRKLLGSPEAVKALDEVQQLMQEKGVDPTTGPTTMQLVQLLSSAEFRKAGKKLKEELEKAGVDLADQELLSAWKNLQKKTGGN
ncbi:hypothetical protein HD554DRAFT_2051246 [Boletus coccyginus]|nr:hypothetical protein HD554DRAFT_2051246 [Boletus coccyginus]